MQISPHLVIFRTNMMQNEKNHKFYKANIFITKCEDFLVLVSITYS